MPNVLISDKLSEQAVQIFRDRGIEVDFEPDLGKSPDQLAAVIGQYDGLAIRSATKATAEIIAKADALKVIGRAGIGVDNIDIAAASAKGVVVMNTPFGNSITTAEHAIAMLLACARRIPEADASHPWREMGEVEVHRLRDHRQDARGPWAAAISARWLRRRAIGLKMKVIAFDPFLSDGRAKELGVEKVDEISALLARADFVTLHMPKNEQTANILSAPSASPR